MSFENLIQQGTEGIPTFLNSIYFYILLIGGIFVVGGGLYQGIRKIAGIENKLEYLGDGLKEQSEGIQKVGDAALKVAEKVNDHLVQDSADKAEFRTEMKNIKYDQGFDDATASRPKRKRKQ
jgi:hypothetical protein